MDKLYTVGAYVRLSMENTAYDSDSIENQTELLSRFIAEMPGWVETKFYVDNGVSGVTFDRPAFNEMMADVRSGMINLVLVKDLSRFGRNYLEAGRYLEDVLPSLGCRFVSLFDGTDTEKGETDIAAFLNAMNDYYVKNLSDKIRASMAAMARDGQKISGLPPYGYRRNPDEPTRLIVDEYAAGIVRRIFAMRAEGAGYGWIVKALNSEAILPPLLYYFRISGKDESGIKRRLWQACTVQNMLRREIYIGNAVQLVKQVVSYRDKREVSRPADEHIRVENAFPAIIERDVWDAVQAVNSQRGKRYANRRAPEQRLFSGILRCADCGKVMSSIKREWTSKKRGACASIHYHCQTYSTTSGFGCTRHTISEAVLVEIVGGHIQQLTERIRLDESAVLQALTDQLIGDGAADQADRSKERRLLKNRLHKLEVLTAALYEDRVTGEVSEERFFAHALAYDKERQEKENRLALLDQSMQERTDTLADIQTWLRLMRENASFGELTRDLLEALIQRIEIGQPVVADGEKQQDVRVVFKFIGSGASEVL